MPSVKDMKREEILSMAKSFREFIELYANQFVDDEMALTMPNAYPTWNGHGVAYRAGDRVRYGDELYRVLQAHESQEGWTPADAPSLFALVLIVDEDEPEEWRQPDSTNAYMAGDVVLYGGVKYMSLIDNNVWSPSEYAAGWQAVV